MVVIMRDEVKSGPYGHQDDPSRSFEVEVNLKLPEGTLKKLFLFDNHEKIWVAKQHVIDELAKGVKDALNYGFYEPPCNGRSGKFLDEERTFKDYPQRQKPAELEFKYKRRVYKSLLYDAKTLQKVHTKANLKKLADAVASNSVSQVAKLTDKGLDPNFQDDKTGETPLTIAVLGEGRAELIMMLINGGAHLDYRAGDGSTALHKAAIAGKVHSVKTLLDLGASPNYRDAKNLTALYDTVLYGSDPYCCEILLNDQADMGVTDHQGMQEIHHACKNGLVQHLEHLLFYGADINATTASGNTPLHTTAISNQDGCARVLLFRGAKRDKLNYANQSAYEVAAVAGNNELAEFIKSFSDGQIVKISGKPSYSTRRRKAVVKPRASSLFERAPSDAQLSTRTESPSPSPGSSTNSIPSSFGDTISLMENDLRGEGRIQRSLSMGSTTSDSSYESGPELSPNEHRSRAKENTSQSRGPVCVGGRSAPPVKMVSGGATMRKRLYASVPGKKFIAVKDYRPNIGGELALQRGDIVEVLYVGEKGFWEGRVGNKNGWFPHACVEELKKDKQRPKTLFGRPPSLSSIFTKSSEMLHRTADAVDRGPMHPPRVVTLNRWKSGYGFQMRGANSQTPRLDFQPTAEFPALQYIGEVEEGGEAEMKGVKCGDFILEVEGEDVTTATHSHVVNLIQRSGSSVTLNIVTVPSSDMNGLDYGGALAYGSLRGTGKVPPPLPMRDPSTTLTLGRMRTNNRPSLFEAGLGHSHEEPANFRMDSVIAISKDTPWSTLQRKKPSAFSSRSAAQFKFNGSTKNRAGQPPKYDLTEGQRSQSMKNISAPPSYDAITGKRPLSTAVPFEIPQVPDLNPHFSRSMSVDPNLLSVKMQLSSHSTPDLDSQRLSLQQSSPLGFESDRQSNSSHHLSPNQSYTADLRGYDALDDALVATPVNATVRAVEESGPENDVTIIATPVEVTNNEVNLEGQNENGFEKRHSFDSRTSKPVSLSSALEQAVAARTKRMDKKLSHSADMFERESQRKISAPAKVTSRKRTSALDKVRSDIMAQLNDDIYDENYNTTNDRVITSNSLERTSDNCRRSHGSSSSLNEIGRDHTDGSSARARTSSSGSNSPTKPPLVPKPHVAAPKPPPAPPSVALKQDKPVKQQDKLVKPKKAAIPMTPVLSGLITTDALKVRKGRLKTVESETPKTTKPGMQPIGQLGSHGNKPAPTYGSQHASMLAKAVAARAARLAAQAQDSEHSESSSSWDDETSDSSPKIPINRSHKEEVKSTKKPPPPVPPKKKSPSLMHKPMSVRPEPEISPRRSLFPPMSIDNQSDRLEISSYNSEEDRTMLMLDDIIRKEVESENWSLNSWNSSDSSATDVVTPPVTFLGSSDDGRVRKSSGGSNSRPWYEYSSGSPSEESLNASTERISKPSFSQEPELYSSQESVDPPRIGTRPEQRDERQTGGKPSEPPIQLEPLKYDPRDEILEDPRSKNYPWLIRTESKDSNSYDQREHLADSLEGYKGNQPRPPDLPRVQTPVDEEELVEKTIITPTGLKIKLMLKKDHSEGSSPVGSGSKSPTEPAFQLPAVSPPEPLPKPAVSPPEPAPKPAVSPPPIAMKPALYPPKPVMKPAGYPPKPAMKPAVYPSKPAMKPAVIPQNPAIYPPKSAISPPAVSPPPLETDIDAVIKSKTSDGRTFTSYDNEVNECFDLPPPPDAFIDEVAYGDIPPSTLPPPPDFSPGGEDSFDRLPAPAHFGDFGEVLDVRSREDMEFSKQNEVIGAPVGFCSPGKSETFAIKPLLEWTCDDVCQWLESIGLDQYIESFRENDIQGLHLPELTKAELRELGVKSLGHRMTMENSVAKLCHPVESSC